MHRCGTDDLQPSRGCSSGTPAVLITGRNVWTTSMMWNGPLPATSSAFPAPRLLSPCSCRAERSSKGFGGHGLGHMGGGGFAGGSGRGEFHGGHFFHNDFHHGRRFARGRSTTTTTTTTERTAGAPSGFTPQPAGAGGMSGPAPTNWSFAEERRTPLSPIKHQTRLKGPRAGQAPSAVQFALNMLLSLVAACPRGPAPWRRRRDRRAG